MSGVQESITQLITCSGRLVNDAVTHGPGAHVIAPVIADGPAFPRSKRQIVTADAVPVQQLSIVGMSAYT